MYRAYAALAAAAKEIETLHSTIATLSDSVTALRQKYQRGKDKRHQTASECQAVHVELTRQLEAMRAAKDDAVAQNLALMEKLTVAQGEVRNTLAG